MIYVGRFISEQCRNGESKAAIESKKRETGLQFTNSKLVKEGEYYIGMDIWVCNEEESKIHM